MHLLFLFLIICIRLFFILRIECCYITYKYKKIESGKCVKSANAWFPWSLPVMEDASAHCLRRLRTTAGRARLLVFSSSVSVSHYGQAVELRASNFKQARDLRICMQGWITYVFESESGISCLCQTM